MLTFYMGLATLKIEVYSYLSSVLNCNHVDVSQYIPHRIL